MAMARILMAGWGIVGPIAIGVLVYLTMLGREAIVVQGAVRAERNEQVSLCNDKIRTEAAENNAAVDRDVGDVLEAVRLKRLTPEGEAALLAMCKASEGCIDRGQLP